jgi:hypothetical protein
MQYCDQTGMCEQRFTVDNCNNGLKLYFESGDFEFFLNLSQW